MAKGKGAAAAAREETSTRDTPRGVGADTVRRVARAHGAAAARAAEATPRPEAPAQPSFRVVDGGAIDPAGRDARKAILARYPAPKGDATIDAPPGAEEHAARYLAASDDIARAERAKEVAGNALMLAIGDAYACEGAAFKASFYGVAGQVDWRAYALALGGTEAGAEAHRRAATRQLRVTRKAVGS